MDLKHYASRYNITSSWIKKDWRFKLIEKHLRLEAKVLDIGCAWGSFYDNWGFKNIEYHGVDYNNIMVKYCKNKKDLDCVCVDISKEKLPYWDNTFDFVYCSHVLEHLLTNEQIFLFSEISRVLNERGVCVLFTPTPYTWYFRDDPTHQRPSTHGSLMHLSKDFWLEVVECKYSNTRFFPQNIQTYLRLPPLRWFLWEVYLVIKKTA